MLALVFPDSRPVMQKFALKMALRYSVAMGIASIVSGNSGIGRRAGALRSGAGLAAPGNVFWTLAGNVSQTVFDAGALLRKQRAAATTQPW